LPIVAVAASWSTAIRVLSSKLICVEKPLTEPVTCQVGGSLPSHAAGSPVGPTGGDSPQACAVWARAITIAAAMIPLTTAVCITGASLAGACRLAGICIPIEADA